jgi:hypothetical protein
MKMFRLSEPKHVIQLRTDGRGQPFPEHEVANLR